jgi:molybdate transport system substrate-binding protein
MTKRTSLRLAVTLALTGLDAGAALDAHAAGPTAAAPRELLVFAAASLREVFTNLATTFEQAHPGAKVQLNLAGSQELRTQIEHGARVDVFASADIKHMGLLQYQALVDRPAVFAHNQPVIIVAGANPLHIEGLADLPKAKRLVVGAPEVPIGGYTVKIFDAAARKLGATFHAQVEANVVSRELNVRQVLAKVTLGEADAGIVYRTDAQAGKGKVTVVEIDPGLNVLTDYSIAVVKNAPAPVLARAWIDLVLSAEGQRQLVAAGFGQVAAR